MAKLLLWTYWEDLYDYWNAKWSPDVLRISPYHSTVRISIDYSDSRFPIIQIRLDPRENG